MGHNEYSRAELWAIAAVRVTTAIESDAKSVVLGLRVAVLLPFSRRTFNQVGRFLDSGLISGSIDGWWTS